MFTLRRGLHFLNPVVFARTVSSNLAGRPAGLVPETALQTGVVAPRVLLTGGDPARLLVRGNGTVLKGPLLLVIGLTERETGLTETGTVVRGTEVVNERKTGVSTPPRANGRPPAERI
jgi:hypothetical protein